MRFVLSAVPATLAATMLCLPAVAQTRFCIGGDLDHLSSAERTACNATLQAVRSSAAMLHAPTGWHFVVVCGEEGWKQYAAFSPRGEDAVADAAADTNLDEGTTFLRENKLQSGNSHTLQRVVAHEIAAALLKTDDETAIQTQLANWDRKSLLQEASLR